MRDEVTRQNIWNWVKVDVSGTKRNVAEAAERTDDGGRKLDLAIGTEPPPTKSANTNHPRSRDFTRSRTESVAHIDLAWKQISNLNHLLAS